MGKLVVSVLLAGWAAHQSNRERIPRGVDADADAVAVEALVL